MLSTPDFFDVALLDVSALEDLEPGLSLVFENGVSDFLLLEVSSSCF